MERWYNQFIIQTGKQANAWHWKIPLIAGYDKVKQAKQAKHLLASYEKHENIIQFDAVSNLPRAVIQDFVRFPLRSFNELKILPKGSLESLHLLFYILLMNTAILRVLNIYTTKIVENAANGIQYSHDVAHRDLILDNILVSNNHYLPLPKED